MTSTNFNSGKALLAAIDKITAIQAKNASTGARVVVIITDANNKILVPEEDLSDAIGSTAYNTICATALTSLNTNLSSTKTTHQTDFDAL